MKVLFIFYRYPLYQGGSYFQEFLNEFAKNCQKVYLIASHFPQVNFIKPKNLEILWVSTISLPIIGDLFFMFASLIKVIFNQKRLNLDIVDSIGPRGLLAAWFLKKTKKISLVCTLEMINEKGGIINNLYYIFVRFLLIHLPIDQFICWSNYYWKNHLKKWKIPKKKVKIIPPGIDTKKYQPKIYGKSIKKRYAPHSHLLVFAKPLSKVNFEALTLILKALKFLPKKLNIKLLVFKLGENAQKLKFLINSLKLKSKVKILPAIPFSKVPFYLSAADLIVLPFVYNPTVSRSVLEALALGKPLITNPKGEIKEILTHRKTAFFVSKNPKKIAKAIKTILSQPHLAKRLKNNGLTLVRRQFDLNLINKKTFECFLALTKK